MRTAIIANVANVVAAAQLNVVAVVRDADRRDSLRTSSRFFGPWGKHLGKSHASKCASGSVAPPASGERAEYPRMLTARLRDGQWGSQRLSTSLLAASALGIAG